MNKSMRCRLGIEKSPAEQFHEELFRKTTEYEYYLLGIAQGIFNVYSTFNYLSKNNINLTSDEAMKIIKDSIQKEEKVNKYFQGFVANLEEDEPKKEL